MTVAVKAVKFHLTVYFSKVNNGRISSYKP